MPTTVFTNGSPFAGRRRDDGRFFLQIDFDDDASPGETYARIEMEEGAHLITNGAVGQSFGRGGTVLEVISVAELQARAGDAEKVKSDATGACTLGYDGDHGFACANVSCTGSCSLKSFLFWTWCRCG